MDSPPNIAVKNDQVRAAVNSLALDLARDGFGVALGQPEMGSDDIEAGRLVLVDPRPIPLGMPIVSSIPVPRPAGRD